MGLVRAGMYPTDDVLRSIGRVVVAASTLEFLIAATHHPAGVVAAEFSKSRLLADVRAAHSALPSSIRLRAARWLMEVERVLDERDIAVHSWAYRPGLGTVDAPETAVARWHPRSGYARVDDPEVLDELVRATERCSRECIDLSRGIDESAT